MAGKVNVLLIILLVAITGLLLISFANIIMEIFQPSKPVEEKPKMEKPKDVLVQLIADDVIVEVKNVSRKIRLLAYYKKAPDYCLEIRGLGGKDYEFFSYVKSVKVDESEEKITVKIEGERSGYWKYTAFLYFEKGHPGFVEVEIKATFMGKTLYGGAGPFYATNGAGNPVSKAHGGKAGWRYPLVSVTDVKFPVVVEMVDSEGKYLFSVSCCDLTGKGSIYGFYGTSYFFEMSQDRFGLATPPIRKLSGTYVAAKYYLYVWRSPEDPLKGVLTFLDIVADKISKKYGHVRNDDYIDKMLKTLEAPASVDDIYMWGSGRFLLKAYVGDKRNRIDESEFITQANVLLGLTYLYNKTQDKRLEKLITYILRNTSYFDVYFDEYRGIYSNNWRSAGRMDSWYQITNPSMLLAAHFLAPKLVKIDINKHERNAEWLIEFARRVDYTFPVFVHPNFRISEPGKEADAALGYSYLMVKLYLLTHNKTYLNEAAKSLEHYLEKNYGKLYESHLTAMGIAAAAHLYKITGDSKYLSYLYKLVYLALRWINLYRGNLIEEEVPFALVSAMPNVYSAAFEYGLFKYFLEEAVRTLGSVKENPVAPLFKFYSRCTAITSKYAFPQVIGIKFKQLDCGKIDEKYWVPIEDIYPVLGKPIGRLPQEIYGFGSQLIALASED